MVMSLDFSFGDGRNDFPMPSLNLLYSSLSLAYALLVVGIQYSRELNGFELKTYHIKQTDLVPSRKSSKIEKNRQITNSGTLKISSRNRIQTMKP